MWTSLDSHRLLRAMRLVHDCVPSVFHHGLRQRPPLWYVAQFLPTSKKTLHTVASVAYTYRGYEA
jgi:hypothetical protein